ncbi:MAG TPA: TIGR02996 domain-containing protein [Gemmataceae bacterium]|jgi:uncharacterized protein (TIGR02996 family)|nr:TIGR02996 domain-containing protein [Gemmataceae bacterium]
MSALDDEAAFSKAIQAAPDDPLPKLIFADWLDERGDPRATCLRWVVDRGLRPVHDAIADTWDWWSRPPREPDYYGGQDTTAAIVPPALFRRMNGKPTDIWKGYLSYADALRDLMQAWAKCVAAGSTPGGPAT